MRKLILAGVVASLLIAAPVALGKIVVGKSIGGVAIGMTEAQVTATFGPPKKATDSTDQTTGQPVRTLEYNSALVELVGGSVTFVATQSKKEKTANGAGVGVKEKLLKKKVKGLKCSGKKHRVCYKGSGNAGTVVTGFTMSKHKKATSVFVGLVID